MIADRIRAARLRAGLRQCDLATAAATSTHHIARIEQGRRQPSGPVARRLEQVLGVDLSGVVRTAHCSVPGCEQPYRASGYCQRHDQKRRRMEGKER